MMLRAYTIYDNKALQYHSPFFTHTNGSALRMLTDLVNDPQSNLSRHPADYSLYFIGQYDDASGVLIGAEKQHVVDALAVLRPQPTTPLFDNAAMSQAIKPNGAASE